MSVTMKNVIVKSVPKPYPIPQGTGHDRCHDGIERILEKPGVWNLEELDPIRSWMH